MVISGLQWQAAFDTIGDAVCLLDMQGKMLWSNASMKRLMGRESPDAGEAGCREVLFGERGRMEEGLRGGSFVLAHGDRRFNVVVVPALDANGDLAGAIHIMSDITEYRQSEEIPDERMRLVTLSADVGLALTHGGALQEMLQECAKLLVKHLDAAFARIWTFADAEDFLILQASAGIYTHFDGPHGRISFSSPLKVSTIARDRQPLLTNAVIGDPRIPEQEWAKREGMVAFAGYPLVAEDHLVGVIAMFARKELDVFVLKALGAIADEITLAIVHKRADEALRESEKKFRSLIETAANPIICISPEHLILEFNPEAEGLHGVSRKDVLGKSYPELFLPEQARGKFVSDIAGILAGKPARGVESVIGRHDLNKRIITWSANRMLDANNRIIGVIAIGQDVTHEKQLETQLHQSQKLDALGTLAGGIAHDFNNILGVIMGYIDLTRLSMTGPEQARGDLDVALKACHRAKDLVLQILSFSRKSDREKKPIQAGPIIKEALQMLRASLPSTISIKQEIVSGRVILANPTEIHQVLMNLCTNSAHAIGEKIGVLEVSLTDVDLAGSVPHVNLPPGPYVRLAVGDTGCGMDNQTIERIFDPFFTTKAIGEGTGLGLSVVHGIAAGCRGAVAVDSTPGKGSTFSVYFPQIEEIAKSDPEVSPVLPKGKERILLVDDEKDLVDVGAKMLGRLGYKVVAHTSGIEALEAFRVHPEDFDLAIVDQTMPRMTGIELAVRLMSARPEFPVILCTGFGEVVKRPEYKQSGIKACLLKPVLVAEIAAAIRQVLDSHPANDIKERHHIE